MQQLLGTGDSIFTGKSSLKAFFYKQIFKFLGKFKNFKVFQVFLKMRKNSMFLVQKKACHRFCHRDFLRLLTPFIRRVGCEKMHSEIVGSGYGGGIGAGYDGWGMVGWGGVGCNMGASMLV